MDLDKQTNRAAVGCQLVALGVLVTMAAPVLIIAAPFYLFLWSVGWVAEKVAKKFGFKDAK